MWTIKGKQLRLAMFENTCSVQITDYTSNGIESRIGEPCLPDFASTQIYEDVPADQPTFDPVGRPLMHDSGN